MLDSLHIFLASTTEPLDVLADLGKVLTGAGGTLVGLWKWNEREVKRADACDARANAAQERTDEVTDRAIAVLVEVNLHLAHNARVLENFGGVVSDEHVVTREKVIKAIDDLKTSNP